jgi:uncharacterized protein
MKLHLNSAPNANNITGHGEGFVMVNGRKIETGVVVTPSDLIEPWHLQVADRPAPDDFTALISLAPALILFGTGKSFRFPDPRIMAYLYERGIGFEAMDTAAACRTYSVLMGEGRKVAAALLV